MNDALVLDSLKQTQAQLEAAGLKTPARAVTISAESQARTVYLKAENLQPTGSFKIRGATAAVSKLSAEQRSRGVVAYSTGNHAQAVALAAQRVGVPATIIMSPDAPTEKIDGTRRYGASVLMAEPTSEARRKLAEQHASKHGLALIPPYDDYTVMSGQASIGIEIMSQCRASTVFVPIGGGGLIAGIAAAIKQLSPATRVIGVEPEWENDAWQSLRKGERVALSSPSQSVADAIKVQLIGEKTFPLIQQYVDEIVLVSEEQIINAIPFAEKHTGASVEPAGAVAVAAALWKSTEQDVVAIVTGANISPERRKSLAARMTA